MICMKFIKIQIVQGGGQKQGVEDLPFGQQGEDMKIIHILEIFPLWNFHLFLILLLIFIVI